MRQYGFTVPALPLPLIPCGAGLPPPLIPEGVAFPAEQTPVTHAAAAKTINLPFNINTPLVARAR